MSDVVAELAPHFFQVAFVVRDLEASEHWFQRLLGVPSFTRLNGICLGEGCEYRGQPSDSEANLSLGYLGDTQLELIEPVRGPSLYTEFLEKNNPGLHHVAFLVPDFEASVEALRSDGLALLCKGQLGPGSQFAYFDCESEGASVVELLGFDEATRGFMAALKAKSAAK